MKTIKKLLVALILIISFNTTAQITLKPNRSKNDTFIKAKLLSNQKFIIIESDTLIRLVEVTNDGIKKTYFSDKCHTNEVVLKVKEMEKGINFIQVFSKNKILCFGLIKQ